MAGPDQRPEVQPTIEQTGVTPTTPDSSVTLARRTPIRFGRLRALGAAGAIGGAALGGGSIASAADQYTPRIETQNYSPQLIEGNIIFVDQSSEVEALAPRIGRAVPVPDSYPAIKVKALTRGIEIDGNDVPKFTEGRWFHPVYDPTHAGQADSYTGIGPHYPVVKTDLNPNASSLRSDGTTGRLIITAREGGRVQIGFMQLNAFQDDGAWSDGVQNPAWGMQYVFNGLRPGQRILPIDVDSGRRLVNGDGSLATYNSDDQGNAAFRIPETHGRDIRVGFIFYLLSPAQTGITQRVVIDRSPIVHPELGGVNSLPRKGITKPMLSGQPK